MRWLEGSRAQLKEETAMKSMLAKTISIAYIVALGLGTLAACGSDNGSTGE